MTMCVMNTANTSVSRSAHISMPMFFDFIFAVRFSAYCFFSFFGFTQSPAKDARR